MKKLITIVSIAVVSLNFISCRQEDDSAEFGNNTTVTQGKFSKRGEKDTIKTNTVNANVIKKPAVDPDPPVKDGTSW